MAENPLYMSPDSIAGDDTSSVGGGSMSRQFFNPLYDYMSDEIQDELAANSYEPSKVIYKIEIFFTFLIL